jgi:DeoR family transcriptional regulator, suf operon transcriptional repressor
MSTLPRPTELAGSGVALANLGPARQAILVALKKRGQASAAELAGVVGMTVGGLRQHLHQLSADGLVTHVEERAGPGRPRHSYRLTPGAEAMFPKRYGELTNQLLGFIEDADASLVDLAFDRRRELRVAQARSRLEGKPFDDRVRELATILDEDGYLADCEQAADGTWWVVEHNCAILDVARRYGNACVSEIAFLREALPDAEVERVAHMIAGAHVCAYQVRARPAA